MNHTLLDHMKGILNNPEISRIAAEDYYHKAKSGKDVNVPVDVAFIDSMLEFYKDLSRREMLAIYLDLANTLAFAQSDDFQKMNTPHVVTYNKSIALAILLNRHTGK
jgi:hypothetical protein